jgi:integrase
MAPNVLAVVADRVIERRRAVALARHYREAEGLSVAQIAERLGRSPATIKAYFYDPTGEKARAVKARYQGACRGCGPKTFAGARDIPMIGELRRICRAHKLQTGRHGTQLFLGRTPADPFYPSTIRLRALKAWGWKQVPNPDPGPPQKIWIKDRADALQPLTPHEARHCAASYMIAAGMDWKKITEFIGHSDVRTTTTGTARSSPRISRPRQRSSRSTSTGAARGSNLALRLGARLVVAA